MHVVMMQTVSCYNIYLNQKNMTYLAVDQTAAVAKVNITQDFTMFKYDTVVV